MLVQVFLAETKRIVETKRDGAITKSAVAAAAQQTFDKYCVTPDDTEVKLVCSGTDTKVLKITVKLLPGHPLFKPWLKPRLYRVSRPIANLVYGNKFKEALMTPVDDEIENLSLSSIIEALMSDIKHQTEAAEAVLKEVHGFVQSHGLEGDSAYQFYRLLTQLRDSSLLEDRELLRLDTVHKLLKIKE